MTRKKEYEREEKREGRRKDKEKKNFFHKINSSIYLSLYHKNFFFSK